MPISAPLTQLAPVPVSNVTALLAKQDGNGFNVPEEVLTYVPPPREAICNAFFKIQYPTPPCVALSALVQSCEQRWGCYRLLHCHLLEAVLQGGRGHHRHEGSVASGWTGRQLLSLCLNPRAHPVRSCVDCCAGPATAAPARAAPRLFCACLYSWGTSLPIRPFSHPPVLRLHAVALLRTHFNYSGAAIRRVRAPTGSPPSPAV